MANYTVTLQGKDIKGHCADEIIYKMSRESFIKEEVGIIPSYMRGMKKRVYKKYGVKIFGNNPLLFLEALLELREISKIIIDNGD